MNIAIVGCGIAGPAAALFLKQPGVAVSVFDKVADLKPVGAGFLLQPAGLDVLNALGLAQSLINKGAVVSGLQGHNHKGKMVLDLRYADLVSWHTGLGMARAVLYDELYQAMLAQGVKLIHPCDISEIDNGPDQVFLKNSEGSVFGPYDCVVIADGSRSRLRHSLPGKIRVKPYDWGALWAIGHDHQQQSGSILEQMYRHTDIMAGILPMGYQDKRLLLSFFWSLHQARHQDWLDTPFPQWQEQVISLWPRLASFFEQFHSHEQFAFARYADISMYPWHDQRVVVIGDAAHGMSPQLGQGANLALIDAQVLSQCLKQYPVLQALAVYSKTRKSQLNFYQNASRFVTPWFQSSSRVMGVLRDQMHGLFCRTPLIRKQMLLTLACMKKGYFKATDLDAFPPVM